MGQNPGMRSGQRSAVCRWWLFITLLFAQATFAAAILAQESEPMQIPELVAIAWSQSADFEDVSEVAFWDAEGEDVSSMIRQDLVEHLPVYSFQRFQYSRVERLRQVVMVFSVDTRLVNCGVVPILDFGDGQGAWSNLWQNQSSGGYVTALAGAGAKDVEQWPDEVNLSIRYSPADPQVFKGLDEDLDQPQDLGNGLRSQITFTDRGSCLEIIREFAEPETRPTVFYEVIARLSDGTRVEPEISSVRIEGGVEKLYQRSRPIDPDTLEQIIVTRREFRYRDLGKVRIRKDLAKLP